MKNPKKKTPLEKISEMMSDLTTHKHWLAKLDKDGSAMLQKKLTKSKAALDKKYESTMAKLAKHIEKNSSDKA